MAVEVFTSFGQQCDANGVPMSGALIYVYDVNSTTPKTVYSDKDLGVSVANPIECDAYGRHDMRYIATGSYKVVTKTSAGTTVYTRDNIDGRVPVGSGALAIANGGTGATSAGAALSALGAATAAELADVTAEVASISGSLASTEKTHIATGTTAQRTASPVDGDIRRNTTVPQFEGYNGSTWEQFVTSANLATQALVSANMPAGSVVNSTVGTYATNADLSTVIPYDDTIPQNTEGTQIISVSHTPASTTNKLRIRFTGQATPNGAGSSSITAAVFKNSTADAIAAVTVINGSGNLSVLALQYEFTPASTSAQTIAVRVGGDSGAIRMNGGNSARKMGGASAAYLVVEEIKA